MRRNLTIAALAMLCFYPAQAAQLRSQHVLDAAAQAMGRFDPKFVIEMRGSVEAEGRIGDYQEAVRARDGAFVSRSRYKLFGEANGFDGRIRWKQDRSAATHHLNAPFSTADAMTLAWLKRRGFLQRGSARVEAVRREKVGGRLATTLVMWPPGGNAIDLTFDNASHLLVRVRRVRPLSIVSETYEDYRQVGSMHVPFKITIDDQGDIQTIRPGRYLNASPARISFSAPPPPRDTIIPNRSIVPLRGKGIQIVTVALNGRQYDFILDSGGHNIVAPWVAEELGIEVEGKGTSGGSGAGRVTQSDTHIARLQIGNAVLNDQHFYVINLFGSPQKNQPPPLGGMLGLETLQRLVITVDKPRARLIVDPPRPGRRCEGDKVPLLFDEDMPVAPGSIDGIPGLIGIDTGNSGRTAVLWRWATANRVVDKFRKGIAGQSSGLGGNSDQWTTPNHTLVVGGTTFRNVDMDYIEDKAGYFSSRVDAANVGITLVQTHPVRFDYAGGHMCILPAATASADSRS